MAEQWIFAEAQAEVMGEWHSAPMVAFGTMKTLSAFKTYCRAMNVPFDVANEVSEQLKQFEQDYKHADDDEKETLSPYDYVPRRYHDVLKNSEQSKGIIDSISPHPCAYIVTDRDVRREIGIIRLKPKAPSTEPTFAAYIDGETAEKFGYLKNDNLAVTVVKMIAKIYERIGMPQPTVPELIQLTRGDKLTWSMYSRGLTLGLNQAEKPKSTEKVKRYKPQNLSEMSAWVAAIRPSFTSMLETFLNRAHFDYGIPVLDSLLQTPEMPNSFILYQELMMKVLQFSGFSAPDSYAAIKAIAKKHPEKVLPMKEKFMTGFTAKLQETGSSLAEAEEASQKVWQICSDACGYGFNASHSVAVALDSMYVAYAKAHYPLETYAALLDIYAERKDKDKIDRAKQEMAVGFGIKSTPCRFGQDNRTCFIDRENNSISDALVSMKGVGEQVAQMLYELRDIHFDTFVELLYRLRIGVMLGEDPSQGVGKRLQMNVLTSLIKSNYFIQYGQNGTLLDILREFDEGENRITPSLKTENMLKRLTALTNYEANAEQYEISPQEQLQFETEVFGSPKSTYSVALPQYFVTDVDDKRGVRIKLYNVSKGTTGTVRMQKNVYQDSGIKKFNVIRVLKHRQKPAKTKSKTGQWINDYSRQELWLEEIEKIPA